MKSINHYIIEKFKLNSKNVNNDNLLSNKALEDLLEHFEFDKLYEIDKGRLMKKPYITEEEGEEIKKVLLKFIKENDCQKENFKYYTNRGTKFEKPKINRDYKKDDSIIINLNRFSKDHILYSCDYGLNFQANPESGIIAMTGPFGGIKMCSYKKEYQ